MPELPELQAHAERLTAAFGGTGLARFDALTPSVLKTAVPPTTDTHGLVLDTVWRRGKYLVLDLGTRRFAVHLMQAGRLRPGAATDRARRGVLARWVFDDGRTLVLTEAGHERRAGVWCMGDVDGSRLDGPPLDGLGPDADVIDLAQLREALGAENTRIHGFLRDQRRIAGIGRMLANEICHRARLSPFAMTRSLDDAEVERLHAAIGSCIDESLAHERTLTDLGSSADRVGVVHHHVGEPCPVCGDTIRAVSYLTYTVAYCPTCQTGGRVLADNTTSKFLK